MIRLVVVTNPFQPALSRVVQDVDFRDGMTLAELLSAAQVAPERHCCVIDGGAVTQEELATTLAVDGSVVTAMPNVAGGGFAKTFAEIAVLVAAAAVTYGLSSVGTFGAFFASAGLGNLSGAAVSAISSGIVLGGNLLINSLMSPSSGGSSSASFDPAGPKTIASGGTPIPKGYGTYRSGGNIIASYVSAEGKDNYLNVLTCHGWGPAVSFSDVRINNNSIKNFKGATYQVRNGSNTQTPIPYFNNVVNGFPQAVRCYSLQPVVVQGSGLATQGLEVVIQFPDGVFYSNNDGSLRSLAIAYLIEYSVSGSGIWKQPVIPRTTHDLITYHTDGTIATYPGWVVVPTDANFSSGVVYAHDNNMSPTAYYPGQPWTGTQTVTSYLPNGASSQSSITLVGEWQPCDPNLNQQIVDDWSAGYIIFTDNQQGALYHTTRIFNLPPAKYDVRVTKYGSAFAGDVIGPLEANNNRTGDQVWIHSINEVEYQDLAYPNMILVGVRALATGQVSGANINVTALVSYGITVALPTELQPFQVDNPAVVAYDMLVNTLYGGGVDPTRIDLPAWAVWAEFCDELVSDGFTGQIKRHVFNGVFDQQGTNLWKSLQKVALMARASIVQIGRNYSVVLDAPVTVPAQVFTVGNIVKDSLQDTWLSLDDRANRVEVSFADAARDYRTDEPCAVMLASDIQAGVDVKTTRVTLLGCTSRAQAWHWAYRKLLTTSKLLLTRKFEVNIAAVACQVGSVIGVQDDITGWAEGGRIQAGGDASNVILDRDDLVFAANAGWTISLLHPVVTRGTGTIGSIVGNVVLFTANLPPGRILSMEDTAGLQGIVRGAGTNTLTLESAAGFSAGQLVTFYDNDVVDTQAVSAVNGAAVTVAAPFIQAPTPDCPWVYGQSAGAFPAKLFTVTGLGKKDDLHMTIETIIYDPSTDVDDTPIITQTLGVPDSNAAVTSLTATEQYALANSANGGQSSRIAVGWQNGPNTAAVELWVATNDVNQALSGEVLIATVTKATTYSFAAATGAIVQIRAVGVDNRRITAPFTTAPVVTITVQGSGQAPADVPLFNGDSTSGVTALTWGAASNAASYELRYNPDANNTNWQSAGLLYAGPALNWTDARIGLGCYLVKALSANSVESVNASAWNYLLSPARLNGIGLAPNQTVIMQVLQNTYDSASSTCTLAFGVPSQTLMRSDGTMVQIPSSSISFGGLVGAAQYYAYLCLAPLTFSLSAPNPPNLSSSSSVDAAACAANGNYPIALQIITTAGSGGQPGTFAAASFQVNSTFNPGSDYKHPDYYNVDSVTILSGGNGYTAPAGSFSGQRAYGQLGGSTGATLTFVSGGPITSVGGIDTTYKWASPPAFTVTD